MFEAENEIEIEEAGTATKVTKRWVELEELQSTAATPEIGVQTELPETVIPAGKVSKR